MSVAADGHHHEMVVGDFMLGDGVNRKGRLRASYLTALGRDEWMTDNPGNHILTAKSLAENQAARRDFRGSARDEMLNSSIMNYLQFARAWESSILELLDGS